MKGFKKIISFWLCAALAVCCAAIPASATETAVTGPIITVSSCWAVPGDLIVVDVSISQNPGIMAMTFTLAYDTEAFTFSRYRLGILNDYMIVDHPDKGYVSFVNCESMNKRKNGTLFAVEFTVNDNAPAGVHDMKIMHIRPEEHGESMTGCFANWKGTKITPTIINGTVNVGYTGSNCNHRFGESTVTVSPMCETAGAGTHTCEICGHSEIHDIDPIGHAWQNYWTVDREATADTSGLMSRHCERCNSTTDKVTFSLKDSEDNGFSNSLETDISTDSWDKLDSIIKREQSEDTVQNDTVVTAPPEETSQPEQSVTYEDTELPESADQLVAASQQPIGLGARLYRLIFGTQSGDGIISIIKNCLPESVKQFTEKPILILVVFALGFL